MFALVLRVMNIRVLRLTETIPIWGNDKNREELRTLVSLGELLLGFTDLSGE